jgi:hypothetical protein
LKWKLAGHVQLNVSALVDRPIRGVAMKLLITALAAVAACAAIAQPQVTKKDIWQPNRHIKDQNITLIPWGSGSIAETNETAYDGAFSIRVATHNYFQGGFVHFNAPVDLASSFTDTNNLLTFTIRSADSTTVLGGGGAAAGGGGDVGGDGPGAGGGAPAAAPRRAGGAGSAAPAAPRVGGKFGGAGGGGGGGAGGGGAAPGTTVPDSLKTVRVIISTTDGKKSEAYLPLPAARQGKPWRSVAIPLKAVNGFEKTNKIIEAIGFSADATSTYYVGDIRLLNDPTPITGEMNTKRDLNLALGDTVRFTATGYGGATILRYTWDFDDADGIQEDAIGQVIEHRFRKAGKYVVTLTIKDVYGLKSPYSAKVNVTVNP